MEETAAAPEEALPAVPSLYREHAPMHKLLSKIPQRIHRGVVGYDLDLRCLAAHSRFMAVGINAGLVRTSLIAGRRLPAISLLIRRCTGTTGSWIA